MHQPERTNVEMTKEQLFKKLPAINNAMHKILLLTHTDLDGTGPAILLQAAMPHADITVRHCGNDIMSNTILTAVENTDENYDLIIVCDISCNKEDAELINNLENRHNLVLLDHHDTASHLNIYDWSCVYTEIPDDSFRKAYYEPNTGHSSGTSLCYDYLVYHGIIDESKENSDIIKFFVHSVAAYDTWDWVDVFKKTNLLPYTLNKLCYAMGINLFEKTMIDNIRSSNNNTNPETQIFTDTCKLILDIEQNKIDSHVDNLKKYLSNSSITIDNTVYSMVYCYTDKYLPYVFEMMQNEIPDADLYAINYGTGVSMRTRKDNIHIGNMLAEIGGGGHAAAGGVKANDKHQKLYMEMILHGKIS